MVGNVGKARELAGLTAAIVSTLAWVVLVVNGAGRGFLLAIYIRLRYGDARLR